MAYKKCGIHRDLTDDQVKLYGKFSNFVFENDSKIIEKSEKIPNSQKDKISKLAGDFYIECLKVLNLKTENDVLIYSSIIFTFLENKIEDGQIELGKRIHK